VLSSEFRSANSGKHQVISAAMTATSSNNAHIAAAMKDITSLQVMTVALTQANT
jgi:hypothetical protein